MGCGGIKPAQAAGLVGLGALTVMTGGVGGAAAAGAAEAGAAGGGALGAAGAAEAGAAGGGGLLAGTEAGAAGGGGLLGSGMTAGGGTTGLQASTVPSMASMGGGQGLITANPATGEATNLAMLEAGGKTGAGLSTANSLRLANMGARMAGAGQQPQQGPQGGASRPLNANAGGQYRDIYAQRSPGADIRAPWLRMKRSLI